MDELLVRLYVLAAVLVPFVFFMASIYLALHIVFARYVRRRESPVLWFFAVVTGPLMRPIRALAAPGTDEARLRVISLGVYVALWIGTRIMFSWLA